jgi:hypothetical protein
MRESSILRAEAAAETAPDNEPSQSDRLRQAREAKMLRHQVEGSPPKKPRKS